jgi:hypothetical protein
MSLPGHGKFSLENAGKKCLFLSYAIPLRVDSSKSRQKFFSK